MPIENSKHRNSNKDTSLFGDFESETDCKNIEETHDKTFGQKVNAWKSFVTDRSDFSKKFEEEFLNHSVLETTFEKGTELNETVKTKEEEKILPFWKPDSKVAFDHSNDSSFSGTEHKNLDMPISNCHKQIEIKESIEDKNQFIQSETNDSKLQKEQLPGETDSINPTTLNANLEISKSNIKNELNDKDLPDKSLISFTEKEAKSISNSNLNNAGFENPNSFQHSSKATDTNTLALSKQEDHLSKKPKYMNGTIPIDPTNEIVENLENKIKQLNSQILNFKVALNAKENTIKLLNSQIELIRAQEYTIDDECIKKFASKGLSLIEEIREIKQPKDLSRELSSLKLENMALKNIIDELALRISESKNNCNYD